MPFIFRCSRCGRVLHKERKPILCNWSYKQQTYLETVFENLGGRCPFCSNELRIPPLEIKVAAINKERLKRKKAQK